MLALTNLSKKLVDKAGPDATAILLSELNSVQDEWEDAAGKGKLLKLKPKLVVGVVIQIVNNNFICGTFSSVQNECD